MGSPAHILLRSSDAKVTTYSLRHDGNQLMEVKLACSRRGRASPVAGDPRLRRGRGMDRDKDDPAQVRLRPITASNPGRRGVDASRYHEETEIQGPLLKRPGLSVSPLISIRA